MPLADNDIDSVIVDLPVERLWEGIVLTSLGRAIPKVWIPVVERVGVIRVRYVNVEAEDTVAA